MIEKNCKKIIAVVGPTASGKTGLAVFLAKKLDGEIVSADSRQVYRSLDIGTGKDLVEYDDIKYHLIDICEPEEKFTMFDWLDRARIVIDDIFKRGKLPIIVGGTGLYVQALVEGFSLQQIQNPKSKSQNNDCHPELVSGSNLNNSGSRNKFGMTDYTREELDKMPLLELQKIAYKLQLNSYNLDLNNPRRLIRFIERAQSGEQMTKIKPDFEVLQIGINLPRDVLYQKIDQRVDEWFRDGIMEEVETLLSRGVDPGWLIKLGLEYRIITEFLTQTSNLKPQTYNSKTEKHKEFVYSRDSYICSSEFEEMQQHLKFAIHAYARRQLTWFRRFPEIKWTESKEEALELVKQFVV